jgi:hypothetical protein
MWKISLRLYDLIVSNHVSDLLNVADIFNIPEVASTCKIIKILFNYFVMVHISQGNDSNTACSLTLKIMGRNLKLWLL